MQTINLANVARSVLGVTQTIPAPAPKPCPMPTLDLTAEKAALWTERAQWNEQRNQAERELKRIDKALALPDFSGEARTVIVRAQVGKGRKSALKQVGEIVVSFVSGWEVKPFWKQTKRVIS